VRRFSVCSFEFVGKEPLDEKQAAVAHVPGNAHQGGGQHRGKLRAFAQIKSHHAGEGRGAELADELDEFECTRIRVGPRSVE
jgi:hypothetical protein